MVLISAVNMFFQAIIYLILGRAIMSWFIRPGDHLYQLYMLLCRVTDPILAPARRLTDRLGLSRSGVDLSPIAALFMLWLLNWACVALLKMVLF